MMMLRLIECLPFRFFLFEFSLAFLHLIKHQFINLIQLQFNKIIQLMKKHQPLGSIIKDIQSTFYESFAQQSLFDNKTLQHKLSSPRPTQHQIVQEINMLCNKLVNKDIEAPIPFPIPIQTPEPIKEVTIPKKQKKPKLIIKQLQFVQKERSQNPLDWVPIKAILAKKRYNNQCLNLIIFQETETILELQLTDLYILNLIENLHKTQFVEMKVPLLLEVVTMESIGELQKSLFQAFDQGFVDIMQNLKQYAFIICYENILALRALYERIHELKKELAEADFQKQKMLNIEYRRAQKRLILRFIQLQVQYKACILKATQQCFKTKDMIQRKLIFTSLILNKKQQKEKREFHQLLKDHLDTRKLNLIFTVLKKNIMNNERIRDKLQIIIARQCLKQWRNFKLEQQLSMKSLSFKRWRKSFLKSRNVKQFMLGKKLNKLSMLFSAMIDYKNDEQDNLQLQKQQEEEQQQEQANIEPIVQANIEGATLVEQQEKKEQKQDQTETVEMKKSLLNAFQLLKSYTVPSKIKVNYQSKPPQPQSKRLKTNPATPRKEDQISSDLLHIWSTLTSEKKQQDKILLSIQIQKIKALKIKTNIMKRWRDLARKSKATMKILCLCEQRTKQRVLQDLRYLTQSKMQREKKSRMPLQRKYFNVFKVILQNKYAEVNHIREYLLKKKTLFKFKHFLAQEKFRKHLKKQIKKFLHFKALAKVKQIFNSIRTYKNGSQLHRQYRQQVKSLYKKRLLTIGLRSLDKWRLKRRSDKIRNILANRHKEEKLKKKIFGKFGKRVCVFGLKAISLCLYFNAFKLIVKKLQCQRQLIIKFQEFQNLNKKRKLFDSWISEIPRTPFQKKLYSFGNNVFTFQKQSRAYQNPVDNLGSGLDQNNFIQRIENEKTSFYSWLISK